MQRINIVSLNKINFIEDISKFYHQKFLLYSRRVFYSVGLSSTVYLWMKKYKNKYKDKINRVSSAIPK